MLLCIGEFGEGRPDFGDGGQPGRQLVKKKEESQYIGASSCADPRIGAGVLGIEHFRHGLVQDPRNLAELGLKEV